MQTPTPTVGAVSDLIRAVIDRPYSKKFRNADSDSHCAVSDLIRAVIDRPYSKKFRNADSDSHCRCGFGLDSGRS